MKYFSKLGVAEIAVEASEVEKNQSMLITGPTTGIMKFDASEIRYDLNPVDKAERVGAYLSQFPIRCVRTTKFISL